MSTICLLYVKYCIIIIVIMKIKKERKRKEKKNKGIDAHFKYEILYFFLLVWTMSFDYVLCDHLSHEDEAF